MTLAEFQSTKEEFKLWDGEDDGGEDSGFNPPKRNLNEEKFIEFEIDIEVSIHQRGI